MNLTNKPSLLYVSTLDHIVRVMLPHLDGARAAGYSVDVACQFTRHREEVQAHADRLFDLPMRRFPLHPANFSALIKLKALIAREKYDIVHCHNPTGGVVGRLAATSAGNASYKPLRVYTAHGFHFHRHGNIVTNALYRAIETVAGHNLSDAVLTINREDYDAALDTVVSKRKLFLTSGVGVSASDDFDPTKVSEDTKAAIREEFGMHGRFMLTVVGELIPRKRPEDAIRAMERILSFYPNTKLVVVGDGALEKPLKDLVKLHFLENVVVFAGFRRDVAAILATSDVFLFPSGQEGLPCSVQEALAMGVPVVATDVRGNRDLVGEDCGRLVPLGDVKKLADMVVRVLDMSPEKRRKLGEAGRENMLRHYDRSFCVADWLAIYETLRAARYSQAGNDAALG